MGFIAPIVAAVAGFAATAAPIIGTVAAGASAYSAIKGASASKQETQAPVVQAPPPTPNYTQVQDTERTSILRANANRTKKILTNPMGETQGAPLQRKQLVGKLGL